MTEELENGTRSAVVNPGELLRAERERVGFTTDEVATHLHLSRTTLGYLEAGRFDRLPGDTFARGYVRSYARLLKLDPNTMARHYDRYVGAEGRETRVSSINRIEGVPRRGARLTMVLSTVLIVVVMLGLGLWWWNVSRDPGLPQERSDVSALIDDVQVDSMTLPDAFTSPAEEADVAADAEVDAGTDADTGAGSIDGTQEPGAEQTEDPVSPADTPAASQEPVPEAAPEGEPQAEPAEAAASQGDRGLLMTFTANCWVQVSVPGGRVLHSRQMNAGDTLTIARDGPLDLVIGAAEAVSKIEFNGQPVELTANRQSGVARLRVGQ